MYMAQGVRMVGALKNIKNNKIFEKFSYSMLGTILIRAVDLISIPIFTRLMDAASYGRVSVFTTYVQVFMVILGLDFHAGVDRATQEYKEKKNEFYSVTLFFTMLWSAVLILIFNVFPALTGRLLAMNQYEFNIMLVYSYAYFIVHYKSMQYIYNMMYIKNLLMSIAVACGNLILSVIFILSFLQDDKFLGRILGAMIPTVIIAIVILCNTFKNSKVLVKKEYLKYALSFSVPLIPHTLANMILANSDRIMIQSMIGDSQSGIYSVAYTVGLMMHVVSEGLNNVWKPLLFRRMEKGKKQLIKRQARIYLLAYTFVAVGVIGVSPEIMKIIASVEYRDGINLVMWLCLSTYFIFVYQLYVDIEYYNKKTAYMSIGTFMAAIVNIALNMLGIPQYGYEVAAISTVVSYAVLILFHSVIVNGFIKERVIDTLFTTMIALGMVGITFVLNLLRNTIIKRYLILFFIETLVFLVLGMMYLNERRNHSQENKEI